MSVLSDGRRMAESRMTDTARVTRVGGRVWDEDLGDYVPSETVVGVWPCRMKHPTSTAGEVEAGSQLLVMSSLELHLPVVAAAVQAGDVVELLASGTRPDQVGRRVRVVAPFDGTQTTALRFRVEVADGR